MISSWVTDFAPWRNEVPMQSEPVSPPPMTMTCLSLARDVLVVGDGGGHLARDAAVLLRQEIHGVVDAGEVAPRRLGKEIERVLGAAGESAPRRASPRATWPTGPTPTWTLQWKVTPSASICLTRRSMMRLLHLEVGNAVTQQAAGLGVLLVDVHLMAGARELLRRGEAGGARADDGDASCRFSSRPVAARSSLRSKARSAIAASIVFDRDRLVVDVERAGSLAGRRAHAARHLGEVVGRVQV